MRYARGVASALYDCVMKRVDADREYGIAPPGYRLPDATHVGRIRLQVSNVERSAAYYRNVLGFEVGEVDAQTVLLRAGGAADHLIELRYEPGTRPLPDAGVLGLYHFAILLPSREMLGRFIRHLLNSGVQFGSADHLVSEATYLWDPDGLGIEVYADRPRDAWRSNDRELMMTTEPLDLRSLVDAAGDAAWAGMPLGTTIGHMHLSVGDLVEARKFYHEALGLETVVWSYPGALFMSAGGYHHHLGTNTWARGARFASAHDSRLLEWELVLPAQTDVDAAAASLRNAGHAPAESPGMDGRRSDQIVIDPWRVALRLRAAAAPDLPTADSHQLQP